MATHAGRPCDSGQSDDMRPEGEAADGETQCVTVTDDMKERYRTDTKTKQVHSLRLQATANSSEAHQFLSKLLLLGVTIMAGSNWHNP